MGRIGETVRRTWQLAHAMKAWRATEAGHRLAERAGGRQRAGASVPGEVHGRAGAGARHRATRSGRSRPDTWPTSSCGSPASFGAKPVAVMKGGWSRGADRRGQRLRPGRRANPVRSRLGRDGRRRRGLSTTFVSGAAPRRARGRSVPAAGSSPSAARAAGRADLVANTAVPPMEVSRTDGTVTLDGRVLAAEPVDRHPLNRRYLLDVIPCSRRPLPPVHLARHDPFSQTRRICPKKGDRPVSAAMGLSS